MVDDDWLAVETAETVAEEEPPQEIPDVNADKPIDVNELGDDDDIPDMEDFSEEDNLVEDDKVRFGLF